MEQKAKFDIRPHSINAWTSGMGFEAEVTFRTEDIEDTAQIQRLFENPKLKWKIVIEDGKQ